MYNIDICIILIINASPRDLGGVKESRHFFEKVSGEFDNAIQKAAAVPRSSSDSDDCYKQVGATLISGPWSDMRAYMEHLA